MIPTERPHIGSKSETKRYTFVLRFIKAGDNVLDCACGEGFGSKILVRKAARVEGRDYSEEAIAVARSLESKRLTFGIDDAEKLTSVVNNSMDAIVSLETIEHLKNQNAFLMRCHSILKPGGRFILSMPNGRFNNHTNPYHINEIEPKKLIAMLHKYGFELHEYYGNYHQSEQHYIARKKLKVVLNLIPLFWRVKIGQWLFDETYHKTTEEELEQYGGVLVVAKKG